MIKVLADVAELRKEDDAVDALAKRLEDLFDEYSEKGAEIQAIAQEKADLQSALDKTKLQLDIFVRRYGGVEHEMKAVREELARLETP